MSKFQYKENLKRTHKSDSEDDDEDEMTSYRSGLFYKKKSAWEFDYYLDGYVTAPSAYRELLHCLNNMQECDSLNIHVNSGGGRLDSTMQLIGAINNSEGNVTVVAAGMAASAASILVLQSPNIIITPFSQMMCHNATYGVYGKGEEILSSVKFSEKYIDKIIHQSYDGFLTETEIMMLKIGQDFYFDSQEIIDRLEKRGQYQDDLDKKQAAVEAKAKKVVKGVKPKPQVKVKAKS